MTSLLRSAPLFLFLIATGCGNLLDPRPDADRGFSAVELDADVTHGYADFGIDLFRDLVGESPAENLFISPTSAAIALAMTYNGAAGETREAMATTLGVSGMSLERLNSANAEWLAALADTQDRKVDLAVANLIWSRQGFPFRAAFFDRTAQFYGAETRELPFDDDALAQINDWVKRNTRGKIETILDRISSDDVMFLINALYFKGQWRYRFDEGQTRPGAFTRLDGSQVDAPMMRQRTSLPYLDGDGFRMVSLPYGNGRFSMVLALPDPGVDLGAFYDSLSPESWESWVGGLQETEVGVVLPRFRIESDKQMNEALGRLGMEIAFSPTEADFSEMSPAQLFIAFVRQKTFVEVDEEGTEAAAVTVVGMQLTSGPSYPVLEFDRPFFFAIQDNATGTILFMGQVTDPLAG